MKKTASKKIHGIILTIVLSITLSCFPVRLSAARNTLIFPFPQQMELTGDEFVLDESVSIIVPQGKTDEDLFLARFLVRELSDKYGLAVKIESSGDIPEDRKVVVMGSVDNPLIKQYALDEKLDLTAEDPGPEGYLLNVSSKRIIIAGWDDAGAFFGLQSLRQLIPAGDFGAGLAKPAFQGNKALCSRSREHCLFQAFFERFYGALQIQQGHYGSELHEA